MTSTTIRMPLFYPAEILPRLSLWYRNHTSRKALSRLDPEQLTDVGLTRTEAAREARKWFWQP